MQGYKSIPVPADAQTSKHLCYKVTANNGDNQGSLSKANVSNGDENSEQKANKHSLAVKDGESPRNNKRATCLH